MNHPQQTIQDSLVINDSSILVGRSNSSSNHDVRRSQPHLSAWLWLLGLLVSWPAIAQDKQVAQHFLVTPRGGSLTASGFPGIAHPPTDEVGFVITGGTQAAGNGLRIIALEHGTVLKRCPPEDFYCSQQPMGVPSDAVFGVWIYQNGNQVFHQTYPGFGESYSGGESQDISFTFLDGVTYTVLVGYRSSFKCNPTPCFYEPARLFWKLEENGTSAYPYQTPEKATWPSGWQGGTGFSGSPPAALQFYHDTRPLMPQLQPGGWQLYPATNTIPQQGIASNFGMRLNVSAPEDVTALTWVFRLPDGSVQDAQTLLAGVGRAGFGYTLPDLAVEPGWLGTESGYSLDIHLTNRYGIRGQTSIPLNSFRLLDPGAIIWDLSYSGQTQTVTQNGIATHRLSQTNHSICDAANLINTATTLVNLQARVSSWGPSSGTTTTPGDDYQLTAGWLFGNRTSSHPVMRQNMIQPSAGQAYQFGFNYNPSNDIWSWQCLQTMPCEGAYQGGDYTELALLKVIDARSGNVHLGPDGEPSGMSPATWVREPPQHHRLRLINEACVITPELTFLDTQSTSAPVASYRYTPGSDLTILIRPTFDASIPIDAVRMRFSRHGVTLGSCYHQVKSLTSGINELLTIPGNYLPAGGPIQLQLEALSGGQQVGCDPNHLPIVSGGITLSPTGTTVAGLIGLANTAIACEDAIISPVDGATNVTFLPELQGGPFTYEWRWSRSEGGQTYYWTGSGWTLPTNPALLFQPVTGSGSSFWSRWTISNGTIQPKAGVAEPFSGLTTSFFRFGSPVTERDRLETQVELRITGTTQTVDTTVTWHKRTTCTPGPALQKVKQLWVTLDSASTPQPVWVDGVSYTSGDANRLRVRVDTDDTSNQASGFSQYWARLRNSQGTQLRCQRVTTDYTVSYIAGAGIYELIPNNSSLLSLLNQEGTTTLELVPDPAASCPSGSVDDRFRVSLTVNPVPIQTPRLKVKLHYRDHLGSSWITKTFRPTTGQTRALEGGVITLLTTAGSLVLTGEAPTFHSYEPFGEPLDGGNDPSRYTDHEYDGESGLNYMKGRFQLATATKFNRPDPMRDWDWTNPSSINLYQYVRNDPINAYDPTGFGIFQNLLVEVADAVGVGDFVRDNLLKSSIEDADHVKEAKEGLAQRAEDEFSAVMEGVGAGLDANLEIAADTYGDAFALVTGHTVSGNRTSRKSAAAALAVFFVSAKTLDMAIQGDPAKVFKESNSATSKLPSLDSTGKVHGNLPRTQDLSQYSLDELTQLRDELKVSVQKRIDVTNQKGSDKPHGQRQAAEQQLIKRIEKRLKDQ